MNQKLNLCEILKDCPKGTKLYCSFLGDVYLKSVYETFGKIYVTYNGREYIFFNNGAYTNDCDAEIILFPSKENRDWLTFESLKPKKERFDPNTLKPFDKVLVKNDYYWIPTILSYYDNWDKTFVTILYKEYCKCIPYNDETAHLAGTTDEAPEYYKWWEK